MQRLLGILFAFMIACSGAAFANTNEHGAKGHGEAPVTEMSAEDQKRSEMSEYVKHHTQDVHDFHIFSDNSTGKHYGFPLPVILWDNGLHVFLSSKFEHGHTTVESKGNYYRLDHGKIYRTNAEGHLVYDDHHHAVNYKPLDLSITKNVFVTLLMALFIFFLFRGIAKGYKKSMAPKGAAKFFEPLVLFIRDDIAIPNIGEKHYKRYMIYLLTVFFFIWFLNLIGMTPLGVNVTGNIAVTFALAIITFIITQTTANGNYWKHIFWMPGVPVPMKIFLMPIELIGIFTKPISLMIRLFANITAGHIIILALMSLIFIFKSIAVAPVSVAFSLFITVIEIVVTAIQAYIFTILSALYFGMATEEEHH
jgi:F-type H+-transporting ATPase subunit a